DNLRALDRTSIPTRYASAVSLWGCPVVPELPVRVLQAFHEEPVSIIRCILWYTLYHFSTWERIPIDMPAPPAGEGFDPAVADETFTAHPSAVEGMIQASLFTSPNADQS